MAAAALAVGIATSNAQVYSANVVGYVAVTPTANQYALWCNPLDLDGVDCITNVFSTAPKGTIIQLWNGTGFTTVSRALIGAGAWSANAGTNYVYPGVGFFISTPSAWTNTFVGTVIPTGGATNTTALTANIYTLVGSTLPVSGTITNAVDQGPNTLNLGSCLAKGSIIQIWNGSGFTTVSRALIGAGIWSTNPTITVGEGFFLSSPATTNWQQTLSAP